MVTCVFTTSPRLPFKRGDFRHRVTDNINLDIRIGQILLSPPAEPEVYLD
jgi:hypothetical protein